MATRAEQSRSASERKHDAAHPKKRASTTTRPKKATARGPRKKSPAPYAAEAKPAAGKRPSRRSSRASHDHLRSDTAMVLRSELRARAPENQARGAKAKAARVKGKPTR